MQATQDQLDEGRSQLDRLWPRLERIRDLIRQGGPIRSYSVYRIAYEMAHTFPAHIPEIHRETGDQEFDELFSSGVRDGLIGECRPRALGVPGRLAIGVKPISG